MYVGDRVQVFWRNLRPQYYAAVVTNADKFGKPAVLYDTGEAGDAPLRLIKRCQLTWPAEWVTWLEATHFASANSCIG